MSTGNQGWANLRMHPRRCIEACGRLHGKPGSITLDQTLPRGELNGLIQTCDCYVSLASLRGIRADHGRSDAPW